MYLSRAVAVACLIAAGSVSAEEQISVCHDGNTIGISENALDEHRGHGDSVGDCPSAPGDNAVAMLHCLKNDNGDLVVSGLSSDTAEDSPRGTQGESCASAIAHMILLGTALNQATTGIADGDSQYLLLGTGGTDWSR